MHEELALLSARFDDNLLDATNAWALYVNDANELTGVPESVLAEARAAAEADGKPGWKLTLRMPCYLPVMSYADNRALRATMHRAYRDARVRPGRQRKRGTTARSSGASSMLRREAAQLLGYPNFAALSLVPKMAKSVDEVLVVPARSRAPREALCRARLRRAQGVRGRRARPRTISQPWDRAYASEKLKARRYAFSEQEVRRYFPGRQGAGGLVPRGGDALRHLDPRERGADVASRTCASSTSSTRRAR